MRKLLPCFNRKKSKGEQASASSLAYTLLKTASSSDEGHNLTYRSPSAPSSATRRSQLPPTALQTNSYMLNNQINAGGDSNIYNISGNLDVNRDMTTPLQKLKKILDPVQAAWDSYEADQRSKCFGNTRQQVLSDIKAWMIRDDSQAPIFVLDGVAGIGKSTVAQTIAEIAAELGILGASFFFTRNEEDRATIKRFFPTIAFQLACHKAAFARKIAEGLESDPDAPQKTIQQQLARLVISPLQSLLAQNGPPIVVVIDALDECKEEEAEMLLTLLAQNILQLPRLRFFITARPEQHLRRVLHIYKTHKLFHLHEIEDKIVQSDIRLYLEHSLSTEYVQKMFPHHQPPWQPSAEDMVMLCGICGKLFIIASTVIKFVLDTKTANPGKRLARLLEGVSPADFSGSKRTDVMDRFYAQIVHHAAPKDSDEMDEWFNRYRAIVGAIIVLQNPLPYRVLAQLLNLQPDDIKNSLVNLHSLVAPSGPGVVFRIHHKSFPDFITSAERIERALIDLGTGASHLSRKLLINTQIHHQQVATACFHIMDRSLKRNMTNLPAEDWLMYRVEIASLRDRQISEELIYATSHWAFHVHQAGEFGSELQVKFKNWAFTHIMSWLEVMSILGLIDRAHLMLDTALEAIAAHTRGWPGKCDIYTLMSDTRRFLLQSSEVIKLSPMHIYQSALPFLPRTSALYRTYQETKCLSVISEAEGEWDPAALATMTGHSGAVYALTFSHDGSKLASASADDTIRLWDGKTGAHCFTLNGHLDSVYTVAFSPDGSRIASGSEDNTIRLWDGKTGAHLNTLTGHSDSVYSVAFSPDGSQIASASADHTIRLWNGMTGAHLSTDALRVIEGHSGGVYRVTYSPDGSRLASGSVDQTLRLWDAKAGPALNEHVGFSPPTKVACIRQDHHSSMVTDLAHSPDDSRFASGSADKTLRLWDGRTGDHIVALIGHSERVTALKFSPNGSRLASGSRDRTIRLWNATAGNHTCSLYGHSDWVVAIAFSPDGSRLASASDDRAIRLWDGEKGTCIATFEGHGNYFLAITFSPDGLNIVSASKDGTFRVLDSSSGSHVTTIRSGGPTPAAAFSPDGSTHATIDYHADHSIYLSQHNKVRTLSLERHFTSIKSLVILSAVSQCPSSLAIHPTNIAINPPVTHAATSDHPVRIIALGRRQNPSVSGLVFTSIPAAGEPVMVPFCWFPPHLHVVSFSIDPTGSSVAVGCENGRVLLLNICDILDSLP